MLSDKDAFTLATTSCDGADIGLPTIGTALRAQHMIAGRLRQHFHTLADALRAVHGHISPSLYNRLNRVNKVQGTVKHASPVEDTPLLESLNAELAQVNIDIADAGAASIAAADDESAVTTSEDPPLFRLSIDDRLLVEFGGDFSQELDYDWPSPLEEHSSVYDDHPHGVGDLLPENVLHELPVHASEPRLHVDPVREPGASDSLLEPVHASEPRLHDALVRELVHPPGVGDSLLEPVHASEPRLLVAPALEHDLPPGDGASLLEKVHASGPLSHVDLVSEPRLHVAPVHDEHIYDAAARLKASGGFTINPIVSSGGNSPEKDSDHIDDDHSWNHE